MKPNSANNGSKSVTHTGTNTKGKTIEMPFTFRFASSVWCHVALSFVPWCARLKYSHHTLLAAFSCLPCQGSVTPRRDNLMMVKAVSRLNGIETQEPQRIDDYILKLRLVEWIHCQWEQMVCDIGKHYSTIIIPST